MAVAHDVSSESHTGTTGHTGSASFTWNHAGGGSARGALVFVVGVVTNALPPVTSVTYGGTTMTAVPYTARDTDTEPGQVTAYYLDNCGTGTKAVVVNRSDATPWAHILYATCSTVTAATATEVYLPGVKTYGGSSSNTAASTSGTTTATTTVVSITDGSPGTNSLRFACRYTGAASPGTAATGSTVPVSIDFTAYGIALAYQNSPSQGAADVGFSSAADDTAIVALAVREIPPILVQPSAAAITVGTATPAVVAQNWPSVSPAAAAVSIAGATPAVGTPVSIAPSAAAVTVGTATPALVAQNWPKAEPAAVAISVAGTTPAVVGQNYILVQPAAAAAAIGTATPAVGTPVSIAPSVAAIAVAGATPTVALPVAVSPSAVAVAISGATPPISLPVGVQPGASAVTIGTATPTVVAQNWPKAQPAAVAIAVAGAPPAVSAVATTVVQPAAASLSMSGATPNLLAIWGVVPNAAALAFSGATPAVVTDVLVRPAAVAVAIAGVAPTITTAADVHVTPGPLGLTITGAVPLIAGATVLASGRASGGVRPQFIQTPAVNVHADDEAILLMLYSA